MLSKIDVELAKQYNVLAKDITLLSKSELKMGELYQGYTKNLRDYVRKMRDKSKQMEILAREERSGIEQDEVSEYKKRIQDVDEQIKMLEGYYDRMKDLATNKKGLVKRMEEFAKMTVENAKIRKDIVQLGLKIEKEKQKMVAASNLSKTEDTLKDLEREYERSKKELDKKWDQLVEERAEVNAMWQAYKDSIDDFE